MRSTMASAAVVRRLWGGAASLKLEKILISTIHLIIIARRVDDDVQRRRIDDKTMGAARRPPPPRLIIQQSTNMLCDRSTSFKLEKNIFMIAGS